MPTPSSSPSTNVPHVSHWPFASPFETPPRASNTPSIFYTNTAFRQQIESAEASDMLFKIRRLFEHANPPEQLTPVPRSTANQVSARPTNLWLSPQMQMTVRPLLLPFRSPQSGNHSTATLTASDAIDARIMQYRYGSDVTDATHPAFNTTAQTGKVTLNRLGAAKDTHYLEISIPLYELVRFRDGQKRSVALYQPTPAGVRELIKHSLGHDRLPLTIDVVEARGAHGLSVDDRLADYLKQVDWWDIVPTQPHICILLDGQQHALPLVLAKDNDATRHVVVLDSTAGSSEGLYRRLAQHHRSLTFWLNKGSRQVDGQSCITDAIEVACHAADNDKTASPLFERIKEREIKPNLRKRPANSRLPGLHPSTQQDDILRLFYLPEELCISAQSPHFVHNASIDLNRSIRINGECSTLAQHLRSSQDVARRQYFNSDTSAQSAFRLLNCYLYTASERHARVLDALAAARQ